jgi:capsular exopolysaccharide synthesis family protein
VVPVLAKINDNRLLITHHDPKSPVSEAFRTLRTNIQFASPDKPLHSIMITSAGPAEGKSTVLANLAIAMAQAGKKVIVVDADMRRPNQHKIFGVPQTPGLTNVLVGMASLEDVFKPTGIDGLSIVPSGPVAPNPSELVGSKMMKTVIQETCDKADVVLFDAPPVVAVTDAAVLAPQLDGVLLLISSGTVAREAALGAKALLEKVDANILGVVLNNVSSKDSYGYYYYYYYYYED